MKTISKKRKGAWGFKEAVKQENYLLVLGRMGWVLPQNR